MQKSLPAAKINEFQPADGRLRTRYSDSIDEYETIRLIDNEGLWQEEAYMAGGPYDSTADLQCRQEQNCKGAGQRRGHTN